MASSGFAPPGRCSPVARVVVRGATLGWDGSPRGGHAAYVLQWLEGLRRAGHDVLYHDTVDGRGADVTAFRAIVERWWDPARAAAILPSGESAYGMTSAEVRAFAREAEVLISLGATYRREPEPWLEDVRPRVLVEQDPGFTHLWADESDPRDIFGDHDIYFTVGANVGGPGSRIPTCGIGWRHTWNPVILDWWKGGPPARPTFTTVASLWSQSYQRFERELWGPKATELLKFLDLPSKVSRPLALALEAGAGDEQLAQLRTHRWEVEEAARVAGSVDGYIAYVKGSAGEFSPVKGLYVGCASGWFSDRSAAYLAAGRPVVTQDTGLTDVLPVGSGLHAVGDVEEAADAIHRIDADYDAESAAASAVAVEHFDSRRIVSRLLAAAGVA